MRVKVLQIVGAIGVIACIAIFVYKPSFPTPDKLLILGTCIGLVFRQAVEVLKRFVPFVALLLIYEQFRGLASHLNTHVNYMFMPEADRFLFGGQLPTKFLQDQWWHGQVQWYDFAFYLAYMQHFTLPLFLAVLIWKFREAKYWLYITTFMLLMFMGFLTYLIYPAAPPWMSSQMGLIEPIHRVSSDVWFAFGLQDFPSVYTKIAPNPVAAVPSLHAAVALLIPLFMITLFKTRWRYLSLIYPFLIWVGTVYQGEHYVIDVVIGVLYAVIAYFAGPHLLRGIRALFTRIRGYLQPLWRRSKIALQNLS